MRGVGRLPCFIGPALPKSFRRAIKKHQNGPQPSRPMKYGVNGTPWIEAENSRFETGDPFWPGFLFSNQATRPQGSTGSSSVRQTRHKPQRLATSDPENSQRRMAFTPSPRQTHAFLTILAVRRRQDPEVWRPRPRRPPSNLGIWRRRTARIIKNASCRRHRSAKPTCF